MHDRPLLLKPRPVAMLIVMAYLMTLFFTVLVDNTVLIGVLVGTILIWFIPFKTSSRQATSILSIMKRFSVALIILAFTIIVLLIGKAESSSWLFIVLGIGAGILVKTEILPFGEMTFRKEKL